MEKMNVLAFGAGAIGTYIGGSLALALISRAVQPALLLAASRFWRPAELEFPEPPR